MLINRGYRSDDGCLRKQFSFNNVFLPHSKDYGEHKIGISPKDNAGVPVEDAVSLGRDDHALDAHVLIHPRNVLHRAPVERHLQMRVATWNCKGV